MATLADILNPDPGTPDPATAGASTDEGAAARRLFAARSGRATAGAGTPAQSSLGELAAAIGGGAANRQAAVSTAPAASALTQRAGEAEAASQSQEADTASRIAYVRSEGAKRQADLLDEFRKSTAQLDERSRNTSAEQLAQGVRLASDSYVNTLHTTGARERLDSAAEFRIAATRAELGSSADLLNQAVANQDWLTADRDQKQRALASLDLNIALAIAAKSAQEAGVTGIYAGAGNAASGAIQAVQLANRPTPPPPAKTSDANAPLTGAVPPTPVTATP